MVLEHLSVLNCVEVLCDAILISFARLSVSLAYRKDYTLLLGKPQIYHLLRHPLFNK